MVQINRGLTKKRTISGLPMWQAAIGGGIIFFCFLLLPILGVVSVGFIVFMFVLLVGLSIIQKNKKNNYLIDKVKFQMRQKVWD